MKSLLSDTSKFIRLNIEESKDYNYIHNQELKIIKLLGNLRDKGVLCNDEYKSLSPRGSLPSVLYGLSKVHKPVVDGIPKLRSILSAINTPTYKISKYLVKLLEPFTRNHYTAKDSFSFAEDIRTQNSNLFMSSLDIDSLFTNIPLNETIDICVMLMYQNGDAKNGLSESDFRELLTLATTESFILFDGKYYRQLDGVAMGSPLGPTLANIFLSYHEQRWLSECPISCKPIYYKRYVDDIFVLFTNSSQIGEFQSYMNSRHASMNFTSEIEYDNSLPFLDVKVIRNQNTFITSLYRKPTFSGVYTNYNSFLPSVYKVNLISTLLFRAFTICSSWSLISIEINHLRSIMLRNAYPEGTIDKVIANFLTHIYTRKEKTTKSPKTQLQVILPYLGTLSGKIEKNIKVAVKKWFPGRDVRVIFRASTRLNSLFTFKDRIPNYLVSGVVYKFLCSRCNSTYIGEISRHIKTRYCEHMDISPLTGKTGIINKKKKPTTVLAHIRKCKCKVVAENFSVLCKDSTSEYALQIKESLFIHRDSPNLNIQGSSVPLSLFTN